MTVDGYTPEQRQAIEQASFRWQSTGRTRAGSKVICPVCRMTGYPGGHWTHKHLEHTECPNCGQVVTVRGLRAHQRLSHPIKQEEP